MKKTIKKIAVITLVVINCIVWYCVAIEERGDILKVIFLNIGQGDAIFIEAPNGNQIVVDGGPPKAILRELGAVMPFYDHTINMLIVTNPDTDHMAGFIDVLNNYTVAREVEPGTVSPSATYAELERTLQLHGVKQDIARRGMNIMLDSKRNIYLEVILPDRDVSTLSTNDGSLIMKLHYGEISYMLMGDAPQKMETYAMALGTNVEANVLKLGHHGSRTSSSPEFLQAVHPTLAVISAGLNNKYGHPHKETLDSLHALHIPYLITFEHGRIVTKTDGKVLKVE